MYNDRTTDRIQSGDIERTKQANERAIFRDEARQHYIQNEEKVELPMVISPRFFVYLWVLSLLLLIPGLIIAFWPLIQQWL
ncbi:MAG: hypothetical protein GWP61_24130 [Chloroflexi bacterium]|nr:hypothetical protein [Chloroflexota bacterium]